ncbi:MAG: outer membrane protein assembly factor BamA [Gammaproteobacteria bacterium]
MKLRTLLLLLLWVPFTLWATTDNTFVVKHITVTGNERISRATVLNYLPVEIGKSLTPEKTSAAIKSLYSTGFFADVQLFQRENTLVVAVSERPTIGSITIQGNKSISKQQLLESLRNVGVAEGRVYDAAVLKGVDSSLQNQYYSRGNYTAKVMSTTEPAVRHRVAIRINIEEGTSARIREIHILGNHAFSEKTLLMHMKMAESRPWKVWANFFQTDRYSQEKLDADVEALKAYYMNHGYLEYRLDSKKVSITPDKKAVYVVMHITEGAQYHITGYDLKGELKGYGADLKKHIDLPAGSIFSRKKVMRMAEMISHYFGDKGYLFATIRPVPEVDKVHHGVFIHYYVTPGQLVYVRRIHFHGNDKTADEVLRREMRQWEGSLASQGDIEQSAHRLEMLGFFKQVTKNITPVPDADDQVDIDFHVLEEASAKLTAGAGYSQSNKFILRAAYEQKNFMGTGRSVGVNFRDDRMSRVYSFSYFNPYFTQNGIGSGLDVYARELTPKSLSNLSNYATEAYGINKDFSIPISEYQSIHLGLGYQTLHLDVGSNPSDELQRFLANEDGQNTYRNVLLSAGWGYMNMDRAIFPTKGLTQHVTAQLALPGGGHDISYYKASYAGRFYLPLSPKHKWVLMGHAELGYGDGLGVNEQLPFYENFMAGGIGVQGEVFGYKGYTLGPKDSFGNAIGGNFLAAGSLGLIFPTPLPNQFRTTLFVNGGNVYDTRTCSHCINPTGSGGPMRYTAGLLLEWRSPLGPLMLAFAYPLNKQSGDDTEFPQFTVGTAL